MNAQKEQHSVWMAATTSGIMAAVVTLCALIFFGVGNVEAVFLSILTGIAFGVLFAIAFQEVK